MNKLKNLTNVVIGKHEFYIKDRPLFTLSNITYPGTSFNMASTMSSSSGMVASLGTCFFVGATLL
jgi:hypothetical protein